MGRKRGKKEEVIWHEKEIRRSWLKLRRLGFGAFGYRFAGFVIGCCHGIMGMLGSWVSFRLWKLRGRLLIVEVSGKGMKLGGCICVGGVHPQRVAEEDKVVSCAEFCNF